MQVQGVNLCVAKNKDMFRLPRLLTLFPNQVLVRSAFGDLFSLTSLVHGPFYLRKEDEYWVLFGTRIADETLACVRIIEWGDQKTPVLQWKQKVSESWRFDEAWIPSQLYIPNIFLIPTTNAN